MLDASGIFVTGTDTGVGKTAVAAALALAAEASGRRAVPLKPAQTGDDGSIVPDARFVQVAIGNDEPYEAVCPQTYRAPLAPSVAAEIEGREVSLESVERALADLTERYDLVVVEGAGGLAVPFTRGMDMGDLAARLDLPVVVAVRPSLGTLNHTLLTLDGALRKGLRVVGIVISGYPDRPGLDALSNPRELARLTPVPILGVLPHDPALDTEGGSLGDIRTWGPAGLDPLLGGTFSPARFRRETAAALERATGD
ncbi:MAG: dethiobiotin synthase [Miltoncostaeaceae bacterium]